MSAAARRDEPVAYEVYRTPRSPCGAALQRLPSDVDLQEAATWALAVRAADREDRTRRLEWLERAKREGAILREGDK